MTSASITIKVADSEYESDDSTNDFLAHPPLDYPLKPPPLTREQTRYVPGGPQYPESHTSSEAGVSSDDDYKVCGRCGSIISGPNAYMIRPNAPRRVHSSTRIRLPITQFRSKLTIPETSEESDEKSQPSGKYKSRNYRYERAEAKSE